MKQLLKTILCAMLMLTLFVSNAFAQEKINQNIYVPVNGSNQEQKVSSSLVVIGDTLYVLASKNGNSKCTLERWQQGMDAPEVILDGLTVYGYDGDGKPLVTNINRLFSEGTSLYGYNNDTGDIYILLDEAGKAEQKLLYNLDISEIAVEQDSYTDRGNTLALFVQDGVLYLFNQNYSREDGITLGQYDFATGNRIKFDRNMHLQGVAPYKDGQLLCLWQEKENAYDEETQQMTPNTIAIFDTKTATATPIVQTMQWGDTGLCYDAQHNTAYYTSGSTVYSLPDMQPTPKVSAYLPVGIQRGDQSQSVGILEGGNFVVGNYDGLYVRGLDMPGIENGALSITGEYGSERHKTVIAKHPEMAIEFVNGISENMKNLTTAMVSGEDAVDLMLLNSSTTPLARMIAKGYAADLSGNPELMAVINRMDPRFVEALQKDGKLYGLPISVRSETLGYNEKVWEETLGLTEKDLPTTFIELLDFIANFYADYGEEHPEINVMGDLNLSYTLRNALMNNYMAYQMKTEGIVTFDTPLFRKLLAALEAIDFKEIDPYAQNNKVYEDNEAVNEFYEKEALFASYIDSTRASNFGASGYRSGTRPLVLALDKDMEPVIPVQLDVMILNPRSKHMEQANQYLSEYAQYHDVRGDDIALFPSEAKAVANPYFESNKKQIEEDIIYATAQIEAVDEENKAEWRENLKSLQSWLKDMDKESMLVTDDMIALYLKKAAPYLYVMQQTPLTDWSSESGNELMTTVNQYDAGAINADTFIKEIDKRVKMMMLEDQ